ncbi:hypothetical protein NUU61_005091 [Penicillium alfredii]|uniref:Nicotinamide N-methyltransferase n=1 Tax=Penicillium alfredii TaxID=1506179 RepID=A0A9W9F8R4_9EURO|nr:uncharacterized protein NUU61_005091 [Penicillium alfredii]KAJ5095735.1 hypothetical protein NUU61_005091 [Penicillium alfredii]
MLHSRLRPLPRRGPTTPAAPPPDLQDQGQAPEEDPEDLFTAFLPHLFPDDAPPFHGDPGQHLLYSSPRYGDLEIEVPSYPSQSEKRTEEIAAGMRQEDGVNEVENARKLFGHFLWSAAMVVAEGVEIADSPDDGTPTQQEAREIWGVRDESVLELGAGTALPSLICALSNAKAVAATDHPSSPALPNTIAFNINHNLRTRSTTSTVSIQPHEWGVLDDSFSQSKRGTFTRIIAADCFWMREQHANLAQTLQWFLAPGGKVLVVAGFHTGRAIVAGFFETVVENGFEIERIYERDLVERMESGQEIRREWVSVREDEGPENRRRWCVIAVLKRKP